MASVSSPLLVIVARCLVVVAAFAVSWPTTASAHDQRPGAVAVREVAPGHCLLRVTPARDAGGAVVSVTPALPAGCQPAPGGWRCDGGPPARVIIPGALAHAVKIVVHLVRFDGSRSEAVLLEGESGAELGDPPGPTSGAWRYFTLGFSHIVRGLDHLLFVLALALLAGGVGRLAIAVTGFTLGHSLTLAAASLGWLQPPKGATELVIAASVLFLAAEAARDRPTLTTRSPWTVAALFGLVHGFGFAGALADLGLPRESTLEALLCFNLGVEGGQLVVLAAAMAAAAAAQRTLRERPLGRLRWATLYAIGGVAGVWTVARAAEAVALS